MTYGGTVGIAPHFLKVCTRWRWVLSLKPRPLYARRGRGFRWNWTLVGSQAIWIWRRREDSLTLLEIDVGVFDLLANIIVTTLTELSQFSLKMYMAGSHTSFLFWGRINPLKLTGYFTYHQLKPSTIPRSAHTACLCVLCGSDNKQRLFSLYSCNCLVFVTDTKFVYCAVRAESLYIIQVTFWQNSAITSP